MDVTKSVFFILKLPLLFNFCYYSFIINKIGDWQWWYCLEDCLEGIGRDLDVDRYWNNEEVDKGHGKKDKSSHHCRRMV